MKVLPGYTPVKMKDEGFYDQHSQVQRSIIDMTLPFVEDALKHVPLPQKPLPLTVVDYGCSEGKNSAYLMQSIINIVRQRAQTQSFSLVFNDLPHNNFNKLFENIYQRDDASLASLLTAKEEQSSVFAFASGQPFYEQVMPMRSVHFGYSSSAAHWLSESPEAAIRAHVFLSGATEEERLRLSVIAASDWKKFLNCRAKEMLPGARLLVTMAASLGKRGKGVLAGITSSAEQIILEQIEGPEETYSAQIVMDLLNEVIEDSAAAKKISKQQAEKIWIPLYLRDLDELLAPLKEKKLAKLFNVEYAGLIHMASPLFKEYLKTGDSERYAQLSTMILRAFTEIFLSRQLCAANEGQQSLQKGFAQQNIIDDIYERVKERIKARPRYYHFSPIHTVLVLVKR